MRTILWHTSFTGLTCTLQDFLRYHNQAGHATCGPPPDESAHMQAEICTDMEKRTGIESCLIVETLAGEDAVAFEPKVGDKSMQQATRIDHMDDCDGNGRHDPSHRSGSHVFTDVSAGRALPMHTTTGHTEEICVDVHVPARVGLRVRTSEWFRRSRCAHFCALPLRLDVMYRKFASVQVFIHAYSISCRLYYHE
jgi:hypothetical protein